MTQTRIKVAIRLRPFLKSQLYNNTKINIDKELKQVNVNYDESRNNIKSFKFDYVFQQKTTQENIYNGCNIDLLIDRAIQGYHSTIFAYGQTGSGKTFTMQGKDLQIQQQQSSESNLTGIIPKLIGSLFKKIKNKSSSRTFTIYLSYLQIYNEKIFDLLNPSSLNPKNVDQKIGTGLRLRWNKTQQFSVENLFVFQCKGPQQVLKYFKYGLSNRIISSHKLNMASSRSHTVLTIRVQSFDHKNPNNILTSKIELVDLAGSQKTCLTGNEGRQAKQSIDINKSLFTLRQVISNLAQANKKKAEQNQTHIPYRDSKLTSILKQSIGGNSYCLMIACINPHDDFLQQNVSTLTYATKTTYITNKPTVNDDPRNKLILELRKQIQELNSELDKANKHIQIITQLNNELSKTKQKQQKIIELDNDQPVFKKKLTQKIGASYDTFSQRLVESINMVRQLLKSNKQLRQLLQLVNQKMQQKDLEIFDLVKENQFLRETNGTVISTGEYERNRILTQTPPSAMLNNEYRKNSTLRPNILRTTNSTNKSFKRSLQKTFNSLQINEHNNQTGNSIDNNIVTNVVRRELLPQTDQKNNISKQLYPNIEKTSVDKYRKTNTILNKKMIPKYPSIQKKAVTIYDHFKEVKKNS